MNPSDFEQNFAAWLDGALSSEETRAFETELRQRGFDPVAERAAHDRVRGLLRAHSSVPPLPNPDFFNHQLMHRIEQEQAAIAPAKPREAASFSWWRLPRMVWAGAASLLIAAALFKAWIPTGSSPSTPSTYFAQVVDSRTFDPTISTSTVYNPQDNVTVLWIDGLDYLPADYALQ